VIDTEAPQLRQLYAEWQAWRGIRELPSRADFDPVQLKYMMGRLSLLDVGYDPLRFHYRVHGTEIADRVGFDMTGKSLEAWPDAAHREQIREYFTEVIATRTPKIQHRERMVAHGRILRYTALALPLSSQGSAIDMLLTGVEFH
jgi:hypothetical protein